MPMKKEKKKEGKRTRLEDTFARDALSLGSKADPSVCSAICKLKHGVNDILGGTFWIAIEGSR